ncbi:MAG TPA: ribosome-associated translation inhibitor RaiA [Acidimicrobiales bacterium]|nr:ribosome-associated translation inhibitor RaiA [Acidimicrobiales bacterium]
MDIAIRGRNIEVTEALRSTVEDKVTRLARFFDGMERAEVKFSEERNPRIAQREVCEVTMHGHGLIVRARAAAPDTFGAVDKVVDKLEHRIEKLKGRLIDRSHPRRTPSVDSNLGAGEPASGAAETAETSTGAYTEPDELDQGRSRIVKTKQFAIKPMTPEEAALQMDLLGHGFFFFTNAETGQAAVVYGRNDGYIGLIDAT